MSTSNTVTGTEFGVAEFLASARFYDQNRKAVDLQAEYPSLEAALEAVTQGWNIVQNMIDDGAGYTPAAQLGFGSESAAAIGESIRGLRPTPSKIRSLFAKAGKK
jgi:hypothetical protein